MSEVRDTKDIFERETKQDYKNSKKQEMVDISIGMN